MQVKIVDFHDSMYCGKGKGEQENKSFPFPFDNKLIPLSTVWLL